jgi:hypothetical protein
LRIISIEFSRKPKSVAVTNFCVAEAVSFTHDVLT